MVKDSPSYVYVVYMVQSIVVSKASLWLHSERAIIGQQLIWQFEIWRDMTVRCDSLRYDSSRYGEIWQFEIQRDMRVRDMTESSVDNIHSMLWRAVSWYVQFQRLIFTRLSRVKIVRFHVMTCSILCCWCWPKFQRSIFPRLARAKIVRVPRETVFGDL